MAHADAIRAGSITLTGHGGDEIPGYLARPDGDAPRGGVLVIHHMPGYDPQTQEIVRRFATLGYTALCPDLHTGYAADGDWAAASKAVRESGGLPDDRMLGDAEGAVATLRQQPDANGRVGVIGFCSGGRQSFLVGCTLPVDAAVDCYGPGVVADSPHFSAMTAIVDRAPDLACPLLGLFGADDRGPSPDDVAELDRILTELDKEHHFYSYPGAGHAFFHVEGERYRPDAAADGWKRIEDFFAEFLRT